MLLVNKRIIVATRNSGKVDEFKHLFHPLHKEVQGLMDYPELPDILEDGATFAENAEKKAVQISEKLQIAVIADDSGLCVDQLGGQPGIFSARYAGSDATDELNNQKLLKELNKLLRPAPNQRFLSKARFVCAIAMHCPHTGKTLLVQGVCEGLILAQPQGNNGFGYDPLFYLPSLGKSMGELTVAEKSEISHRGKALRKLLIELDNH